ncbi:MAG: YqaA family protein [Salinivirgaceae bacterium]|jgi:membrane protein YqaA with SNARE-associated domain
MFQLGYWALFFASFLAATIVPFSSEAILSGMMVAGYSVPLSLVLATAGNWLGGLTSFYLGYIGKEEWISRYLRIRNEKTDRFKKYITGKEQWIAFFCWLPFVGDVLAVALGLLKTSPFRVALGMLLGKALRYLVWAYFTLYIMQMA